VQSNGPAGLASLTAISANLHPPTPTKGSIGEATGFASVAWVQIEGTLRPRVEMQVLSRLPALGAGARGFESLCPDQ